MSRSWLIVSLALAAFAGACHDDLTLPCATACDSLSAATAPAAPRLGVVANEHAVPFQYSIWGCGEEVLVQGTEHFVWIQGDSLQGAPHSHTKGHFRETGAGVGLTTGTQYEFVKQQTYGGNWNIDTDRPAGNSLSIGTWRLVSRDTMPDLVVRFTSHVTVTPNGDLTVDRYDFQSECR